MVQSLMKELEWYKEIKLMKSGLNEWKGLDVEMVEQAAEKKNVLRNVEVDLL